MTEIRTHRTTVQGGLDDLAFLPPGWARKGAPVLVVAGVPEGLWPGPDGTAFGEFDAVPAGWQYRRMERVQHSWGWRTDGEPTEGAPALHGHTWVQCRPVQPATERVPWHEAIGRRCETRHGNVATVDHVLRNRNAVTLYSQAGGIIREAIFGPAFAGMVEVLVDGNEAAS